MHKNLHTTILSRCQERGNKIAFRMQRESGGYREVTWAQYRERTLRFSSYLKKQGVKAGDKVLLASENGPEWSMAALAVHNLGAILVPVASIASFLEIQNILHGARPAFCIVSNRCAVAKQIEGAMKLEFPHYLFWDLQKEEPLSEWIEGQPLEALGENIVEDSIANLIYTSGTTGQPKAVPISHKNILTNALDVIKMVEASDQDRIVSVLPLSHMLEFTGGFVIPAYLGASVTYLKSLKAEDLLQAMRDTKASVLIAVPLLFEIIARNLQAKIEQAPKPVGILFQYFSTLVRKNSALGPILFFPIHRALGGNIRYFMAGGSKLQPATFEFFRGIGITLLQGYGLTETSPVLTITNLKNAAPDHVGLALPHVELGIFDDKGTSLSSGSEGEICAKGPSIFSGYASEEHNKNVFFDGWFRTGDLGVLDANGLLRITGRKKDIIVTSAGKNVYPEEIEETVLATGNFLEASAFGLPDSSGHEKICLVLVPDKSKFLGKSQQEVLEASSEIAVTSTRILSEYKWPQRVEVFFEELPKTISRKIKKHEVRKLVQERDSQKEKQSIDRSDDGAGENGLDLSDELEATIAHGIASITKMDPAKVKISDSLTKDLGLDSLTFVELISHVEKKFGTQIDGVDFASILTVEDLVRALEFAAGSRKTRRKVYFADFSPRENKKILWALPRKVMNALLRLLLRTRYDLQVYGLENLRSGGPFIFTPNHSSHFDMLSIAGSIPSSIQQRTFAVAAKDYFFNKTWKAFFARIFINAIPFDRKGRVNESMNQCREVLMDGDSLTIFPEGTRSPDGQLQAFKQGVGQLLASHPKAMAVPVYIEGAFHIMPKGSMLPGAGQLRIYYGKPISFQDVPQELEGYRKIAERLRQEVADLSKGKLH